MIGSNPLVIAAINGDFDYSGTDTSVFDAIDFLPAAGGSALDRTVIFDAEATDLGFINFDTSSVERVIFRLDNATSLDLSAVVITNYDTTDVIEIRNFDTIYQGPASHVTGTAFQDSITGGRYTHDTLNGAGGDDIIDGGYGGADINGGDGNDTIDGGYGGGLIHGEAGDDSILGGYGGGSVFGGEGNDTIRGGQHITNVFGGAGDDSLRGGHHGGEIRGGEGNDTIQGGHQSSDVYGGVGDDVISGS